MIKDQETLKEFEEDFLSRQDSLSYEQSRRLFAALWKEGIALGVLPPTDPLAGIETDIRVARILNACLTKSLPG